MIESDIFSQPPAIKDIDALWDITLGDPAVKVAILDGPVNLMHPCLIGSNSRYISNQSQYRIKSSHGTFITSLIAADHASKVKGLAPECSFLLHDIYSEKPDGSLYSCTQSDIAAGILNALEHGANIINISGGESVAENNDIMPRLVSALNECEARGVLVIAATGNEGDSELHVPARYPTVLAVGSVDLQGLPSGFSNWTDADCLHGITTIGEGIHGAVNNNQHLGIASMSGTSFSTALISGVAALLASWQHQHQPKNLLAIREWILQYASPCTPSEGINCSRILAGRLNINNIINQYKKMLIPAVTTTSSKQIQSVIPTNSIHKVSSMNQDNSIVTASEQLEASAAVSSTEVAPSAVSASMSGSAEAVTPSAVSASECACQSVTPSAITPSATSFNPSRNQGNTPTFENCQLVCAIGQPAYNFGTEANQDIFKAAISAWHANLTSDLQSLYPNTAFSELTMAAFLQWKDDNDAMPNMFYSSQLVWILSMNATPVYSITPDLVPFNDAIYLNMAEYLGDNVGLNSKKLRQYCRNISMHGNLIDGKSGCANHKLQKSLCNDLKKEFDTFQENKNDVMRMSLPGYISGETRLLNGSSIQSVTPVAYGINNWTVNALIASLPATYPTSDEYRDRLISLLNRLYINTINRGQTPDDRALNYAIYNIIAMAQIVRDAANEELQFTACKVTPSKIARQHSEMRDVQLTFFNPANTTQASTTYALTVDVSAITPILVGNIEQWQAPISVASL
ncbi:S8 family serine peptidase [bacterium]|nr:S8 family serine peptidase [bacterium]